MKRIVVSLLAAVAMGLATAAGAQTPPPTRTTTSPAVRPLDQAELEPFVDGVVTAAMQSLNVAGVEVAIVQGGRPILVKGYGRTSLTPERKVDPNRDLFRIGSISKTFTWILLMREVERGRLRLDDPVNQHLPPALRVRDQGFSKPVRLIDLMSHAAGFEALSRGEFVADPEKVLSLEDRLKTQFPERVREPGLSSSYSDQGTELAGYIVARLNGVDFETLAERDIFRPLGMSSTTFRQPYPARAGLPAPMPAGLAANLSTGFGASVGDFKARPFEFTPAPSGSVSSTAADMARYMTLQLAGGSLDGVRLYGPETARAFRTQILDVPDGVNGWAHGFIVYTLPGGYRGYGHSGGMLSFLSNMIVVPDLDLGIFVTTNTDTGWGIGERLPEAIVERFYAPPPGPRLPGNPKLLERADAYAGRYISSRRAASGLIKFRYLVRSSGGVSVTPDGYVRAIGEKWAPTPDPARFRALNRSHRHITFQLDSEGRATSYLDETGTGVNERAGWIYNQQLFMGLGAYTLVAALATLVGAFTRRGRDISPTSAQRAAAILELATAVLWLGAFAGFATWMSSDTLTRVYGWPGGALLSFSIGGLLAWILALLAALLSPLTWRGGPPGWNLWRKLRHSTTLLGYGLFGAIVWIWGGFAFWDV